MNNTSHTSELPTHRGASGPRPRGARIVIDVDLSAVIFVVLALAWAVYLNPKALKHHDELASDRLVEGHSDKVRVLSVLVLALAVVAGLAGYAVVPWWSTAIPGGMVVLFLLGARLSVRRIQARRKERLLPGRWLVSKPLG